MTHWLCWVAVGCAIIGLGCVKDAMWQKHPLAAIFSICLGFSMAAACMTFFNKLGWLPK